ncbi:MAG: DUF4345 domain-containing protein [Myxococcota bacterium]
MSRGFVIALTTLILGVGIMYLVDPAGSMEIAEIDITSAPGRTEIRGMYGGLHLALGLFMLARVRARPRELAHALQLAGLVFGCVAFGRVLGFAVDGEADLYNMVVTAIETAISSLSWVLWRRAKDSREA